MLRRAGGRVRFLPADLLGWPLIVTGTILLTGVRTFTNRVADGPWTVRLLVESPSGWFSGVLGWVGLGLLAVGVFLAFFAKRRSDPHRWGTAVRYPAFAGAAAILAAGAVLSMWRAFGHVTDIASGGAEWRFLAVQRTHWANDLTTVLFALAAAACFALSFGPRRWSDFEAFDARQTTLDRVPATMAASARMSSTMPTGVATHRRSSGGTRPPPGS
jgi:hypothetical protein